MEYYVNNGNAKIWTDVTEGQKGKYVILCNGGPGCCDYLLPVSQMIDDAYTVIRFEQRGCGRSEKDGKYDLETALSDLEAIREFYGIKSWIVGGHSWGAALSLLYSINYPDRVNSFLFVAGIGVQNNREWIHEFFENLEKHGETMPDMLYPFNADVNKIGNASFCRYIQKPSLYKDIEDLKMPALFLCAEKDLRSDWPIKQIQALIENSVFVTIPEATHYIWLTHYNEMRIELRKFLGLLDV